MLADALMAIGKAGIKGGAVGATRVVWPLFKGVTYGLSQAAFDINIQRLDSWLNFDGDGDGVGNDFPLAEFEVTLDNPDGTGEIIIPVRLQWKEERDAFIYTMFLMSGTMMYYSFVRYYFGKMVDFQKAAKSAKIAGDTAEVAIQTEKAQDLQMLIKNKQESIIRMKGWVQDLDMADNLKGLYSDTWVALESQVDDLANFDELPDWKKKSYIEEIEIQKKANIAGAEDAAKKAKKASKSNYGKFIKAGVGVVDIGLFIGTGLLSLLISKESEQGILEGIFGEETVEKYNLTMPLGISDLIFSVVLTELFIYFGDDLEEVGIPATPETLLAFALALMGDYWEIMVDVPQLTFDLSGYTGGLNDFNIADQMFEKGIKKIITEPYWFLEIMLVAIAGKAMWTTYSGMFRKKVMVE